MAKNRSTSLTRWSQVDQEGHSGTNRLLESGLNMRKLFCSVQPKSEAVTPDDARQTPPLTKSTIKAIPYRSLNASKSILSALLLFCLKVINVFSIYPVCQGEAGRYTGPSPGKKTNNLKSPMKWLLEDPAGISHCDSLHHCAARRFKVILNQMFDLNHK